MDLFTGDHIDLGRGRDLFMSIYDDLDYILKVLICTYITYFITSLH